jgi:hypothetical protein
MGNYRKRFGDRYDGRLLRSIDPFFRIIPYIMKTRTDSQTFFDEKIDLNNIESFVKLKKDSDLRNISFLHIIIAALVRTISQKPGINRFVAGQKIYARNEILISLAVKKQLLKNSPETTIKFKFKPTDTLYDVVDKINTLVEGNKKYDTNNETDRTAKIIALCPGFLIKFVVWFFNTLDYFGFMPKIINRVSPFHTSAFITDLGSIGIQPVYHHIYNFGTTSIFIAFGAKQKEKIINKDNNIIERKYINIKIVTDERIIDGYYFASAFKLFKNLMMHPENLELPPEKVIEDLE